MRRFSILLTVVSLLLVFSVPVVDADNHGLDVSVAKAPVAPDGTTAGAQSDHVVTFADRDPAVPGFMLGAGDTIEIELPEGTVNVGELPDGTPAPVRGIGSDPTCVPGNLQCSTAVVLRGWPQSAAIPDVAYDEAANTVTLTLLEDVPEPGAKQTHFIGLGFRNPKPGKYQVGVTITEGGAETSGAGVLHIIPKTRPSINSARVEFTDPGFTNMGNSVYQTVAAGTDPMPFIFYLWERGGAPFAGVSLEMDNADKGRLVAGRKTVGQVRIEAPPGAAGYTLTSLGDSYGIPGSFAVNVPTAEWQAQFTPTAPGDYTISFRMNGGTTQTHFVTVE